MMRWMRAGTVGFGCVFSIMMGFGSQTGLCQQTSSFSIEGTITDAEGRPVPSGDIQVSYAGGGDVSKPFQ
jgi:hypothetical protein